MVEIFIAQIPLNTNKFNKIKNSLKIIKNKQFKIQKNYQMKNSK